MATKQTQTNTTESVKNNAKGAMTQAKLDESMKKAAKELQEAKKVKVTIPKIFKNRLGTVVPVGINGAVIYLKVGETYEVPEPYKKQIERTLEAYE